MNYTKVKRMITIINSYTCDKCGKEYSIIDDNEFEVNEFHHIEVTGGYGSVFGDESKVTADICQHCLKEMIEGFCYVDGQRKE